ncbi:MAG: Bug family tripartite tricarboxylate transporter substrate binding protein [Burkholderiaceae bacterium]
MKDCLHLARSALLAVLGLCCVASGVQAQTFPTRPVTIVVPFAPGGGPDIVARRIAVKLSADLGVPVVVDNRDGAGGRIGTAVVARAAPDGHTLLLGTSSALALAPALYKDLQYNPETGFAPVGLIVHGPLVLSVRSELPVTDVRSLVEYSKRNPGRLNFGSAGVGSVHHVAAELLRSTASIDMTHVPYKGGAPAWLALTSGEVDVIMDAMFGGAMQTLASGKARAIAVTGDRRLDSQPKAATFREQGIQGLDVSFWWGMLAPANTPAPVVATLNKALRNAVSDPELVASFAALGLDLKSSTPDDFTRLIASEGKHWRTAAETSKLRLATQ